MPIPQMVMLQPKNLSLFQQQTTINYFGNTFDSISQIKIEKRYYHRAKEDKLNLMVYVG